jgi:hypothetical protein
MSSPIQELAKVPNSNLEAILCKEQTDTSAVQVMGGAQDDGQGPTTRVYIMIQEKTYSEQPPSFVATRVSNSSSSTILRRLQWIPIWLQWH